MYLSALRLHAVNPGREGRLTVFDGDRQSSGTDVVGVLGEPADENRVRGRITEQDRHECVGAPDVVDDP